MCRIAHLFQKSANSTAGYGVMQHRKNEPQQWRQNISKLLQILKSTAISLRKLVSVAELLAEHNVDIQLAITNCCDQLHRMGMCFILFFLFSKPKKEEKRSFIILRTF